MNPYADTGFLVSLYLEETTSPSADAVFARLNSALPLIPLGLLELRNAFNPAIVRDRITETERDRLWAKFEEQRKAGIFENRFLDTASLYNRARELSDLHTPVHAARSLDLLHVTAALLLNAQELLTFDERQRRIAEAEGLRVRP